MEGNNELLYFARNVSILRNKNNLSKIQMAKLLGISVKSLNKLENGIISSRIGVNVIFNIQKYFGISPKNLFIKWDTET